MLQKRQLRSVSDIFVIKEHCIFCGKSGEKTNSMKRILTKTFEDFLIWNSVSRDDEWKVKVIDRLYHIHMNTVITNIVDARYQINFLIFHLL